METGAPMPGLLLRGSVLFVAYIVRDDDGVNEREECYAVVRFGGVLQHTFGYPNDEALGAHPLFSSGLALYAFNEVWNSPYVRELAARNAKTHPGSEASYLRRKHWIVPFHDETLEVIGDTVEFIRSVGASSAAEAIAKVAGAKSE